MRVRPAALAVHTVLLTALVGGTFAYVSAQRTVTLDVDGSVRTVDTYARSVGDLLASAAVQVDARDAVSPALATTLVDGLRVAVVSARPVSLVVDGRSRQVWTTARSVDELTRQLGGRYRDAALSASRSTRIPLDGLALSVRMPKTVRVTADGRTVALVTTAATWRAALAEAGITVGASDSVSVDLAGAPVEGRSVTVTRRLTRSEVRIVAIPFTTQRRADATLYQGTTRVVQAGTPGRLRQTWVSTVVDGKVVARKQVGAKVLTAPVPRVVAVGTKARPAAASAPPRRTSVDSLNWAALARCESGGNPRAVGGGGQYFGLYQFSLGTWRSVGGPGHPLDASAAEQTYRAKRLYLRSGASPWPHCGRLLFT